MNKDRKTKISRILGRKSYANSIEQSVIKRKEAKDLLKYVKKNNGIPRRRDKFSLICNAVERFKSNDLTGAALRKIIFCEMIMSYHDGYMKSFRDYGVELPKEAVGGLISACKDVKEGNYDVLTNEVLNDEKAMEAINEHKDRNGDYSDYTPASELVASNAKGVQK